MGTPVGADVNAPNSARERSSPFFEAARRNDSDCGGVDSHGPAHDSAIIHLPRSASTFRAILGARGAASFSVTPRWTETTRWNAHPRNDQSFEDQPDCLSRVSLLQSVVNMRAAARGRRVASRGNSAPATSLCPAVAGVISSRWEIYVERLRCTKNSCDKNTYIVSAYKGVTRAAPFIRD